MSLVFALLFSAEAAKDQVNRGVTLYDQVHFEEAYTLLDDALRSGELKARKDQLKAKRYAAFSLFWLKRKDEARNRLREYLRADPTASINADDSPPELVAFFNEVKAALPPPEVASPPPQPKRPPPKSTVAIDPAPAPIVVKPTPAPASATVETPRVEQTAPAPVAKALHAPWYLKIIPFGVGQLANRDFVAGGIYLGLDVALLAANIAVYMIRVQQRDPGGTFANVSQAETLRWTANGLAIGLYAMLVWNIVDAFVLSDARVDAKASAAVVPTTNGAALVGSF